jgi:hypothetical protein
MVVLLYSQYHVFTPHPETSFVLLSGQQDRLAKKKDTPKFTRKADEYDGETRNSDLGIDLEGRFRFLPEVFVPYSDMLLSFHVRPTGSDILVHRVRVDVYYIFVADVPLDRSDPSQSALASNDLNPMPSGLQASSTCRHTCNHSMFDHQAQGDYFVE